MFKKFPPGLIIVGLLLFAGCELTSPKQVNLDKFQEYKANISHAFAQHDFTDEIKTTVLCQLIQNCPNGICPIPNAGNIIRPRYYPQYEFVVPPQIVPEVVPEKIISPNEESSDVIQNEINDEITVPYMGTIVSESVITTYPLYSEVIVDYGTYNSNYSNQYYSVPMEKRYGWVGRRQYTRIAGQPLRNILRRIFRR